MPKTITEAAAEKRLKELVTTEFLVRLVEVLDLVGWMVDQCEMDSLLNELCAIADQPRIEREVFDVEY